MACKIPSSSENSVLGLVVSGQFSPGDPGPVKSDVHLLTGTRLTLFSHIKENHGVVSTVYCYESIISEHSCWYFIIVNDGYYYCQSVLVGARRCSSYYS